MKGRILSILKAENGIVSGEVISSALDISRVSVWKHIRKLQESGYDIRSTPTGYQIMSHSDLLFPWEFTGREGKIHYYAEVSSTMDIARELARKGSPHFTVVISGIQTKGRGRLKRAWLSDKGGIYFTIILRPQIPVLLSSKTNFMASVVLVKTLREMFGIEAMVKWPNDILVSGRKVSGMLSEMEAEADMLSFINIGIGINANNDPSSRAPLAISLKQILKRDVSRKEILTRYLDALERRINAGDYDRVIPEWKYYTCTINKEVKIVTTNGIFSGLAIDVDENGSLILKQDDGAVKSVSFGDCFHS
ncbi:MAG: BirA family transcriptional regulator [Thermodesulfobacteriota bacterium]|nr:BirA family transcriptional regulator [Thermodesulfobacteriota bacterium]